MARHKEKDDEAGGEGLGKLLTRKRLWRDSTGAIVSKKRPEHEKERKQPAHPRSTPSSAAPQQVVRSDTMSTLSPQSDLPLSPRSLDIAPASNGIEVIDPLLLARSGSGQPQVRVASMIDVHPAQDGQVPFQDIEMDSLEFLCNGSWGTDSPYGDTNPDAYYSNHSKSDLGNSILMKKFSIIPSADKH